MIYMFFSFLIITILILIVRRIAYFMEKHNFGLLQALGAALVAWIADVPGIVMKFIEGIKYGILFLSKNFKEENKGENNEIKN